MAAHDWQTTPTGDVALDAWENLGHRGVVCRPCGTQVCIVCQPFWEWITDCSGSRRPDVSS